MNPFDLKLKCVEKIDWDTELALLCVPVLDWEPVTVQGDRVIDGVQRVLVARKHGFVYVPVRAA